MSFRIVLVLGLLLICLGHVTFGQEGRTSFRARRPVEQVQDTIEEQDQKKEGEETILEEEKTEETETVEELENNENDKTNGSKGLGGRGQGGRAVAGRPRQGGIRGGGGRGGGGRGMRPKGGQRRPAVRRPTPNYDYYDYYYDEYYDADYYEDYYEEETQSAEPPRKRKKQNRPFSRNKGPELTSVRESSSSSPETQDSPDSPDYGGIIKKLWAEFLAEKQNGGGGDGGADREKEKEEDYECTPREASYFEPDEEQCDKYFECNIKGEIKEHLCPDGFTFDITLEKCDYPAKVNCSTRPLLQEPQPSVNCSRANGFFPWPANQSCQHFWDCRQGTAYKQTCPVGVIFDPALNTCATPDQSSREECTSGINNFFNFTCPIYSEETVLKFGNHDRLPHPTDCQRYFSCLKTGGPRLATCPRKQVFNKETGHCGDPGEVPGCENYWVEKLKDTEKDYYYEEYDN